MGIFIVVLLIYVKRFFDAGYEYELAKKVDVNTTYHYKLRPSKHNKMRKRGRFASESTIEKEIKKRLRKASTKKIILIWGKSGMVEDYVLLPGRRQCGKCEVSYNRSLINDSRTGAVVYHFKTDYEIEMPMNRNPNHLHIFWNLESAATMKSVYEFEFDNKERYGMNATMGYRVDSDFFMSYRYKEVRDMRMGRDESVYKEIMKPKSKFAMAVISNCGSTPGARIRYLLLNQLLMAGLRIDLYGDCFSSRVDNEILFEDIPRHKFYFAYENSYHCKDYITEKLFQNALNHDSVPVVWGGTKQDYVTSAPPDSFIFAEDFETPRHLIDYLERLDQNNEEYLKYFRWRTMRPEDHLPFYRRAQGFCAICRALHGINADNRFNPRLRKSTMPLFTDGIAKRTIPSLKRYLFDSDNPECFDGFNSLSETLTSEYDQED